MLPACEVRAAAPGPPATAPAVVVEDVPQCQELQQAAQVVVERMAARRHWPQVQIYVPAPDGSTSGGGDEACGIPGRPSS